jgi:hypothetical protein
MGGVVARAALARLAAEPWFGAHLNADRTSLQTVQFVMFTHKQTAAVAFVARFASAH